MSLLRMITGALAFWLIISAIQMMRGVTRQRLATNRRAKSNKKLDQEQEKAYRKVMNFQLLKVAVAAGLLYLLAAYL